MRQCLCSDSPRFTRKPIPPLCLLAPPSLFPPLFLHFSSSLHFFFRPSLYTFLSFFSLLGEGMAVSPQKKHLLCTEMRVLPELEATPPPAFLISVSVSTSPLSPSTCNSLSRFFFPPFFLSSPLFRLHFASFVTTITRIFFSQLSPF